MLAMKKILVPIDFSEASKLALSYGRGLARRSVPRCISSMSSTKSRRISNRRDIPR